MVRILDNGKRLTCHFVATLAPVTFFSAACALILLTVAGAVPPETPFLATPLLLCAAGLFANRLELCFDADSGFASGYVRQSWKAQHVRVLLDDIQKIAFERSPGAPSAYRPVIITRRRHVPLTAGYSDSRHACRHARCLHGWLVRHNYPVLLESPATARLAAGAHDKG